MTKHKHPPLTPVDLASGIEDLILAHLANIDHPDTPLPGWRTMTAANVCWIDQSGRLRVNLRPLLQHAYDRATLAQDHPLQWLHLNLNPRRLFGVTLIRALTNRGWDVPAGPTRGRRYWVANPTLTAYLLDPTEDNWSKLPGNREQDAQPNDEFTMDSISHSPTPTYKPRPTLAGEVTDPLDDDEWIDPLADLQPTQPGQPLT